MSISLVWYVQRLGQDVGGPGPNFFSGLFEEIFRNFGAPSCKTENLSCFFCNFH